MYDSGGVLLLQVPPEQASVQTALCLGFKRPYSMVFTFGTSFGLSPHNWAKHTPPLTTRSSPYMADGNDDLLTARTLTLPVSGTRNGRRHWQLRVTTRAIVASISRLGNSKYRLAMVPICATVVWTSQ